MAVIFFAVVYCARTIRATRIMPTMPARIPGNISKPVKMMQAVKEVRTQLTASLAFGW